MELAYDVSALCTTRVDPASQRDRTQRSSPDSESGCGHFCPSSPGPGPIMTGAMPPASTRYSYDSVCSFAVCHLFKCCVCWGGGGFPIVSLCCVSPLRVCVQSVAGVCYCVVTLCLSALYVCFAVCLRCVHSCVSVSRLSNVCCVVQIVCGQLAFVPCAVSLRRPSLLQAQDVCVFLLC